MEESDKKGFGFNEIILLELQYVATFACKQNCKILNKEMMALQTRGWAPTCYINHDCPIQWPSGYVLQLYFI